MNWESIWAALRIGAMVLLALVVVGGTMVAWFRLFALAVPRRLDNAFGAVGGHPTLLRLGSLATGQMLSVATPYLVSRIAGFLPSRGEWGAQNHGPWRYEVLGMFLWGSFLFLSLLVPASVIAGAVLAFDHRRPALAAWGLGIAALAVGYLAAENRWVLWVVD